ncbi:MAG: hypothetical protein J6W37_10645 [Bacteroidales bacterium]|nr:hypothetical protein [Bacteroidales bacterium]
MERFLRLGGGSVFVIWVFFVLRQNNKLYYVEGKTLDGKNSLDHLIEKGSEQSSKIVIDIIGTTNVTYLSTAIKTGFEQNHALQEMFLLKGSRLIRITRKMLLAKTFLKSFGLMVKMRPGILVIN